MYRRLGVCGEDVCELGAWKNGQAFTQHYQRLDAHERATEAVLGMEHKSSLLASGAPEVSGTPATRQETGGRDTGGAKQESSEPSLPPRKRCADTDGETSSKKPCLRFQFKVANQSPTAYSSTVKQ